MVINSFEETNKKIQQNKDLPKNRKKIIKNRKQEKNVLNIWL